ncbi:MAG: hypothetical protein HC769_25110 [Cyanobacteria bacterium CRU_2_1]|nr:hypothetical protein [Cyanobacteria bacterium RU_5_0]NJR61816.1 hypothetical protein [Cyanobacteria bacterium CRU_2_1]
MRVVTRSIGTWLLRRRKVVRLSIALTTLMVVSIHTSALADISRSAVVSKQPILLQAQNYQPVAPGGLPDPLLYRVLIPAAYAGAIVWIITILQKGSKPKK